MLRRKLTQNIPLKIVSLLIGFLIWLVVVNLDNPRETRTFTIQGDSVELVNTAYIDSFNKMCMKDDDPEPVRVTVTAERKTLRRIMASDISLVADMQQAVSLETNPVMVPITASCSKALVTSIKVSPQFMGVTLEDKVSQEYVVTPSYGDTKPGKGYEVGSQTVNPERVKITGPKSLMGKIDKVVALVNIGGKTRDVTEDVYLSIRDKNQDILSDGKMATLTIDNGAKATVTTRFWKILTGVGFVPRYYGEPEEGYRVESVTTVPDSISIAGTDEALEALKGEGNLFILNDPALDITGCSEDFEQKLSVSGYLPTGTKLTTGSSEDIYVTIKILPEGAHEYSLASGDIRIENLSSALQASFESDSISLRIQAENAADIARFRPNFITASVDLAGLEAGSYEVPVSVILPEGYSLLQEVDTGVTIAEFTDVSLVEENEG